MSTDADGDGYGGTDDCNDQSSAVHPGAAEVCDGLDAGSSSYGRTTDFWGVTRSGNPDLGAVEY